MATIVLGTAFGDEGKGKLVDILSRDVKLCARAQVGPSPPWDIYLGWLNSPLGGGL